MTKHVVIVRGFGGEPRKLAVVSSTNNRVVVVNPEGKSDDDGEMPSVSLPRNYVYEFNERAFDELLKEYILNGETRDETWRLTKSWSGHAQA